MGSDLIVLEAVEKTYNIGRLEVNALRGIDLKVTQGEHLSIVGPSGSGKSTLLNIIGGIDWPTSGNVTVAGNELTELSEGELALFRRKTLGFVFQLFNLIPTFTALENVMLPLELNRMKLADAKQRAQRLLEEVELEGRGNHLPAELSVGEQQRVAIARALANEPLLILADEPTGNLDQETGGHIMDLLVGVNATRETTLLVVTHSLDVAHRAKKILKLVDGKLAKG